MSEPIPFEEAVYFATLSDQQQSEYIASKAYSLAIPTKLQREKERVEQVAARRRLAWARGVEWAVEDEKRWVRGKKKRTDEDNEAFGRAIAHYLYVEGERLEEAADLFVNHYYDPGASGTSR